jgi:pyruvate dehydrogenase E2 component (dihydrolipoamide acetyltransferase)
MMKILKLPDLGEGLLEAEVVEWFCQEGETVSEDQPLLSVETAKAIVEIPSPCDGVIGQRFAKAGELIHTQDPLLAFEQDEAAVDSPASAAASEQNSSHCVVGSLPGQQQQVNESADAVSSSHVGVKATPAVRALASRLDIDLNVVTPSGPDGTIRAADVERVQQIFNQVGVLKPLTGVRRAMSKAMSQAHSEVVPVTINDDADISRWLGQQDITVRLVESIIIACKAAPQLNAWYDSHAIGCRQIPQVHLGLAVDTADGLFVPVIHHADELDSEALRTVIDQTINEVVERKISADRLRGNTITLSNFGPIGGRYANPIIMPPTVAIVGAGRSYQLPALISREGEADIWRNKTYLPLSLSFDHRCITGGEAAGFLQAMIKALS